MNKEDRGMLVGMVLGDAYLNVRLRENKYWNSEMVIAHSIKQFDYLQYKSELVRRILGGNYSIKTFENFLPKTGKSYKMCRFSVSNKYFKTLKGMMYPDGKKRYSKRVLDMLTPHGVALWYMDDGSAGRNHNKSGSVSSVYTTIATYCTEIEAQNICDFFKNHFGIAFRIGYEKAKGSYIVRANTTETKRFAELIKQYIIPSMQYKLSHVQDLFWHERQTPLKKSFECIDCGSIDQKGAAKDRCRKCYKKFRLSIPEIREKIKEAKKIYYLKNTDRIKAKSTARYLQQREIINANRRKKRVMI